MKFLCEHCKAKYQIADDKVAGRTVRMKCRKCGGQIEVRAAVTETSVAMKSDAVSEAASAGAGSGPPPGRSPGRPSPIATSLAKPPSAKAPPPKEASSLAGAFHRNVQRTEDDSTNAGLDLRELSAADEWYVAVNGVPVGPVRVGEVRRKAAMGVVNEDSLCWQEGMEEWRAVRTVTELAAVVREAAAGGRTSQAPPEPPPPSPTRPAPPRRVPTASSPAWAKPAGVTSSHRAVEVGEEDVVPTIVGRSPLLDDIEPDPPPAPTNGAADHRVAPDPFAAHADPFKPGGNAPFSPHPGPPGGPFPPNGQPYAAPPGTPYAPPPAAPSPASFAPPIVAPAPPSRLNPIAIGMILMFVCFGVTAAYFLFGQPKPIAAKTVASAAGPAPSAAPAPTDIPPPTAAAPSAAPTTPATPQDVPSSPAKVASNGTGPAPASGRTNPNPKAGSPQAIDLSGLLPPSGGGPSSGPTGGGGGGPQLTEDDVRSVVSQHSTQIKRTCWERSGATTPSVNEKVHIVVGGSGSVQSASAVGNDPVVGHCLEEEIKRWHWPGGGEVDVPFHFLRQ